jgi:hypothetical protein
LPRAVARDARGAGRALVGVGPLSLALEAARGFLQKS